jgi:hypothetical protein
MLIELTCLNAALLQWLKTPDSPICEISPNRTEKLSALLGKKIRALRETMKRYRWQCCMRLLKR